MITVASLRAQEFILLIIRNQIPRNLRTFKITNQAVMRSPTKEGNLTALHPNLTQTMTHRENYN